MRLGRARPRSDYFQHKLRWPGMREKMEEASSMSLHDQRLHRIRASCGDWSITIICGRRRERR